MDYKEYKVEAGRTMAQLGELVHDSMHMVIGMNTESSAELLPALKKNQVDITNIKEEIGDLMWYVANYASIHTFDLQLTELEIIKNLNLKFHTPKDLLEEIIITIGELQDLDKKFFAYKKPYNQVEQYNLFFTLKTYIETLCYKLQFDLGKILQTNIDKLRARYPEKFTENNAVNRNLDKERQILENEV